MKRDKRYINEKSVDELKKQREELKKPIILSVIFGLIPLICSFIFYNIGYAATSILLLVLSGIEFMFLIGLALLNGQLSIIIFIKEKE